jgi:hypothetical protein
MRQNVPAIPHVLLIQSYSDAFSALLWLLTAITTITAIVVFAFLGRGTGESTVEAADLEPEGDEEALNASNA